MVGTERRDGRYRPSEQRPPPSWKGRKRRPTRTMSENCDDVGGTPMMARLTRSFVWLVSSSRCWLTSFLVRSVTLGLRLVSCPVAIGVAGGVDMVGMGLVCCGVVG